MDRLTVQGETLSRGEWTGPLQEIACLQIEQLEALAASAEEELLVAGVFESDAVCVVELEFTMAIEMVWHHGIIGLENLSGEMELEVEGNWELQGLTGAQLEVRHNDQPLRVETYDDVRHRWSRKVTLGKGDRFSLNLRLDERTPASLAYFSPSNKAMGGAGCAAVAVVAPVRPQLGRPPVHVAFLLELQGQQDEFLATEVLEAVMSVLATSDRVSVFQATPDGPVPLIVSGTVAQLDGVLAPASRENERGGASADLLSDLQSIASEIRDCTHFVLAVSSARVQLEAHQEKDASLSGASRPVFIFPLRRKSDRGALERIVNTYGGFVALGKGNREAVEGFRDRVQVRLSPPLLRDFKLEGWGLEGVVPPLLSQVYCDEPTLVFGEYEGLLPKTVTLSGFSQAGKKLAQRVRVESVQDLRLEPIFRKRQRLWTSDKYGEMETWCSAEELTAFVVSRSGQLEVLFSKPLELLEEGGAVEILEDTDSLFGADGDRGGLFGGDADDFFGSAEELFSDDGSLFTQSQEASLENFLADQDSPLHQALEDPLESRTELPLQTPPEDELHAIVEGESVEAASKKGEEGSATTSQGEALVLFAEADSGDAAELYEGPASDSGGDAGDVDLYMTSVSNEEETLLDGSSELSPEGVSSIDEAELEPEGVSVPVDEGEPEEAAPTKDDSASPGAEEEFGPSSSEEEQVPESFYTDEVELFQEPVLETEGGPPPVEMDFSPQALDRSAPPQLSESFSAVMVPDGSIAGSDWEGGPDAESRQDNLFDFSRFEDGALGSAREDEFSTPSGHQEGTDEGISSEKAARSFLYTSEVSLSLQRALESLNPVEVSGLVEVDHLALALGCLEQDFQRQFLNSLDEWEARVLGSQIAWGLELETKEREKAVITVTGILGA